MGCWPSPLSCLPHPPPSSPPPLPPPPPALSPPLPPLVCPPTLPNWVFNLKVSALTSFKHRLDKVPLANKWINGEINNAASRLHSLTSRTDMHTSTQGEIDKQWYWGISWGLCLAQCDGWFICSLQEVVNQCLPSGQLGSRRPGNLLSVTPQPCRFRRLYASVCAFSCLPPKMIFQTNFWSLWKCLCTFVGVAVSETRVGAELMLSVNIRKV